ncbi:mucin-3B-like [Littorina saxatilis]|uniref:mucin-3B-like n=1 Tax=Littorina saxatilis TaxID=31220 RepID=UPI0038B6A864
MEADNQPSVIPRKRKRVTNPRHNVLSASERKRRYNQNQRVQKAKVVSIGKQVNRWNELKESLGLTNHSLAELLLDTYETTKSYSTSTTTKSYSTSTTTKSYSTSTTTKSYSTSTTTKSYSTSTTTKMLHTEHEAVPHVPVSVPSRAASEKEPVPGTSGVHTSTPATTTYLFHMGHPTPGMSEISAAESESEGQLSGVEKILATDSEDEVGPKQGRQDVWTRSY